MMEASTTPENQIDGVHNFVDSGTPTVQFRYRLSTKRLPVDKVTTPSTSFRSGSACWPIEVVDSEDEELQKAIETSIEEANQRPQPLGSLQEVLASFQQEAVSLNSSSKFVIFRSSVLESALRALDRKHLNFRSRIYVKFSGEMGEDHGGPRREFFRLAVKSLHESKFFDGPETAKYSSHSLDLLEKGHYRLVGRLVGLSLAQEGPGLHFLCSQLFDLMVGNKTDLSDVESLLPADINELIKQLEDADNAAKMDAFLMEHGDQLLDKGFISAYRTTLGNKGDMILMLKKHYLYYRISGEIAQFIDGMNDVSKAWELVRSHAQLFKPIFCYAAPLLSAEQMQKLFNVCHSEKGSNNRALEDVTVYGWELFLLSVEAGGEVNVTYPDVLMFVTGADHIPPYGFSKLIDIQFYNYENGRLPHVSTCALELWLPRINDPDSLSAMLVRAITESGGFLKV